MIMGLNELEFAFISVQKLLDVFCGLVVHDVELRLQPLLGELLKLFLDASKIVVSSNALIGSAGCSSICSGIGQKNIRCRPTT
jgi:hypothetical protein